MSPKDDSFKKHDEYKDNGSTSDDSSKFYGSPDRDEENLSVYISTESKYEMKITRNSSLLSFVEELKSQSFSRGGKDRRKTKYKFLLPGWNRKRNSCTMTLFLFLAFVFASFSFLAYTSISPSVVVKRNSWLGEAIIKIFDVFEFEHTPQVSEGDMELFEKAKAVSALHPVPGEVTKIAFMFLTRGPLPLAPLWSKFFSGHEGEFSIYIHANPHYEYGREELPEVFRDRVIRREPVVWSGLSMVSAERRLLATALLDPLNWYFVLVSETCIPLQPFPVVKSYISSSPQSFITVTEQQATWNSDMLPLVPLPQWRKGDEWKELHREAALVVVSDSVYFDKFSQHVNCFTCDWHKTGAADEHYIPTLLFNTHAHLLANRTLHWVDWNNHYQWEHPHTYYPREVTAGLLRELQGTTVFRPFGYEHAKMHCTDSQGAPRPCYLFARKFANASLHELMKLSKPILGY